MLCDNCASPASKGLVVCDPGITKKSSDSEKATSVKNELLEIESMIKSLVKRRTMVRKKLNKLSLLSRLPAEILTLIFKLACEPSGGGHPKALTPLFLGSISHEWREMVWSTPRLWNSPSILLSLKKDTDSQMQLLKDWLSRAKSSPLHIRIDITGDIRNAPQYDSFRTTIDVLATRSSYWSSLYAVLPSQCNDIFKNKHFPALTSICIKFAPIIFLGDSQKFELLSAPKLVDVEILEVYMLPEITLPWNQLQRFRKNSGVKSALKVLELCPNLKEYHLICWSSGCYYLSTPLRSELTVLDIALEQGGASSFLENVVLPSLRDLRIHKHQGGHALLSIIKALVIRSSCELQSLDVEQEWFQEDDLISCLESLSSLLTLRLISTGNISHPSLGLLTTKVIPMLHPSYQSGNPLLPNLVTLEYRGPVQCDEDSLMSVLSDRWRIQNQNRETDGMHSVESEREQRRSRLSWVSIFATGVTSFSAEFRVGFERLVEEEMFLDIRSQTQFFRQAMG